MDPYHLSERNAFVTHAIDRDHARRLDDEWLAEALLAPETQFVVVWQDQVLVNGAENRLSRLCHTEVTGFTGRCPDDGAETVLLGILEGVTYFGVGLSDACDPATDGVARFGEFHDLRGVAALMNSTEGALAVQAKAMLHWRRQHRFCGRCGAPTRIEEAGYVSRCTDDACGQLTFPRVDPAIIVLVTSSERCLLGRQPHWPKGRYSNIAGFVEPGESLETAVAREVHEETGITIRSLAYHSSQPWPFPQSLMVGFTAQAATQEIQLTDGELEDAKWLTREEIRDGLLAGTLGLPSAYSISFHLIEDWFDAGTCGSLDELPSKAW